MIMILFKVFYEDFPDNLIATIDGQTNKEPGYKMNVKRNEKLYKSKY